MAAKDPASSFFILPKQNCPAMSELPKADLVRIKRALISVSDKRDVVTLARKLADAGGRILKKALELFQFSQPPDWFNDDESAS